MEKKKAIANSNVVERVKVTHSFVVGDETLNVKVKIINVSRVGLRVDVDGPVKVAMNYSEYVLQKMKEKMKRERGASAMLLFGNNTEQPQHIVTSTGISYYPTTHLLGTNMYLQDTTRTCVYLHSS
ncbi:hypothetical protein JHK87_042257 [Glycine soja]|nr:hypothetical protein JHK87_042257 [Glycine soja]